MISKDNCIARFKISKADKLRLDALAKEKGISFSELIESIVLKYLNNGGNKK